MAPTWRPYCQPRPKSPPRQDRRPGGTHHPRELHAIDDATRFILRVNCAPAKKYEIFMRAKIMIDCFESEVEMPMAPHVATHTTGKIILPGVPSRSCTIVEISDKGAALKVSSIFGIPETFDMSIGPDSTTRHCKVIHKAPNRLDVLFE
jgi:hypothetical protein